MIFIWTKDFVDDLPFHSPNTEEDEGEKTNRASTKLARHSELARHDGRSFMSVESVWVVIFPEQSCSAMQNRKVFFSDVIL